MITIYMTQGLAAERHQELSKGAAQRRLIAALPTGPGLLQRFALRIAGCGRRPAVVRERATVAPRAYGPLAI